MKILVTGSAGFIGYHLCKSLLKDGYEVFGVDNMNKYYSTLLKTKRLENLLSKKNFSFRKISISDYSGLQSVFEDFKPDKVVNLAAQAGVRYSLKNPHSYIDSNLLGFTNVLECCRHFKTKGLIYASSSSVYGGNLKIPFSIDHSVDKPISLYAATKRSNELIAFTYNHLFGIKSTGLRYFTVYGPWGRPDMAIYLFAEKINNGNSIDVFNYGDMQRDFTYIDDVINGTIASIEKNYDYEIFNIGNNKPENIIDIITLLEKGLGKKANIKMTSIQPGDVEKTYADIEYTREKLGYDPQIKIRKGIERFLLWFKIYNSSLGKD